MANCADNVYVIKYTDTAKGTITITKSSLVTNLIDIALVGKSRLDYGEAFNENVLHLLENFSAPELSGSPGNPDTSVTFGTLLTNPVQGQKWWNSTVKRLFVFSDGVWLAQARGSDVAGNWGTISNGGFIPRPVGSDGYVFPYNECSFVVSPHSYTSTAGSSNLPSDIEVDYMRCFVEANGKVTMEFRYRGESSLRSGYANYQIIGIRGEANAAFMAVTPYAVPAPTPGVSATLTPTPTPTPTGTPANTPAPSVTPASTVGVTPTRTVTPTPTITVTRTVTPTPTPTNSPSPSAAAPPCYSLPYFYTGFMFTTSNGGTTSCADSGFAASGTPIHWLEKSGANDEWYTTFSRNVGSDRKENIGGLDRWWPRPAARVTVNLGPQVVSLTVYGNGQGTGANGTWVNSQSVVVDGTTYTVTLSADITYTNTVQIDGNCNNVYYYTIAPTVSISPPLNNCTTRPPSLPSDPDTDPTPGGCVTCETAVFGYSNAAEVSVNDDMAVINASTYELGTANVSKSEKVLKPCVRIETASGVVLECSTTAPIADENGNAVLAPNLMGVMVPVYENGMVTSDEVISVTDIGDKEVQFITCENNYFLAAATAGRYLLHHNKQYVPTDPMAP